METIAYPLTKPRAGVKVIHTGTNKKTYQVTEDIVILPAGIYMIEKPGCIITDKNGNEIKPTGRFLYTAETIDPYHIVTDMF